jgi:ABC-type transport system substrate-binding protein
MVPRPDLAESPPDVSADGMTWTFHLRDDAMFGPPFEDVPIVAQDVIDAVERTLRVGSVKVASIYFPIEGAGEYRRGTVSSVAGLAAPDEQTLVVHLSRKVTDLDHRFALPGSAPLVPPQAAAGAVGHALVASGPYMIEGTEIWSPGEEIQGYIPGVSLALGRNPAWDPSTDPTRGDEAYIDRFEIEFSPGAEENTRRIGEGSLDLVLDQPPSRYPEVTAPGGRDPIHRDPTPALRYLVIDPTIPPFDDPHIRRAVALVLDRAGLQRINGSAAANVAWRLLAPSLRRGAEVGPRPFLTRKNLGSPDEARDEMARSRYDRDVDGSCEEAAACRRVMVIPAGGPGLDEALLLIDDLAQLGITARAVLVDTPSAVFDIPLRIGWEWRPTYPGSGALARFFTGIGAGEMARECELTDGDQRSVCWAELDATVTTQYVWVVPYLHGVTVRFVSERVINYVFDGFTGLPALEELDVDQGECSDCG